MTDNISHERLEPSYTVKRLQANAVAIATWTEELGQIGDWDSPAAQAIRKHIAVLADSHGCIMGLSENEIARIDDTPDGPGLFQGLAPSFEAIEAQLPPEKILQIKRHLNGAFALMCGTRFDPVIAELRPKPPPAPA